MSATGNFCKLSNMMGNYRNILKTRIVLPVYQPYATLKQSVEEKLGIPPKPKRPLTPYFMFVNQMRPAFREKHPDAKLVDLTKILAQEWQKTDDKYRTQLDLKYKQAMEEYKKVKAQYDKSLSSEQKNLIEQTIQEEKAAKDKRRFRKMLRSLGKPVRPSSPLAMYAISLGEKRGSMELSEWQKATKIRYESLPEAEKQVYEDAAAQAMLKYRIDLKNWEQKMEESGQQLDTTIQQRDTSQRQSTLSSDNISASIEIQSKNVDENFPSEIGAPKNDMPDDNSPSTPRSETLFDTVSSATIHKITDGPRVESNVVARLRENTVTDKTTFDITRANTLIDRDGMPTSNQITENLSSIKQSEQNISSNDKEPRSSTNNISRMSKSTNVEGVLGKWSEAIVSKLKSVPILDTSKLHREYVYFGVLAMSVSILCFYNLMYHP